MAEIARIKPISEGLVRVSLDITKSDFISAEAFDHMSTVVQETVNDSKRIVWRLEKHKNHYLGEHGATINLEEFEKDEKITMLVHLPDKQPEAAIAKIVKNQNYLTIIEEQMKTTLTELKEAEKSIKEV